MLGTSVGLLQRSGQGCSLRKWYLIWDLKDENENGVIEGKVFSAKGTACSWDGRVLCVYKGPKDSSGLEQSVTVAGGGLGAGGSEQFSFCSKSKSHWRVLSRGKWREQGRTSPFCKWIKGGEAVAWHRYYRYPGERRWGPVPGWGCKMKPEGTSMASHPCHLLDSGSVWGQVRLTKSGCGCCQLFPRAQSAATCIAG